MLKQLLVICMLIVALASMLSPARSFAGEEPRRPTETVLNEAGVQVEIPVEDVPRVAFTDDQGNTDQTPASPNPTVELAANQGNTNQTSAQPSPVVSAPAHSKAIPDQYIVVLKAGADPRAIAAIAQVTPKYVYDAALNGFAAQLNPGQLTALQHHPNVDYIEQDMEVTAGGTQTMDGSGQPWGLDRIDQHNLPLSKTYTYNSNGAGVRIYIFDTGLQTNHEEFGGRAQNVFDYESGRNGNDCNGHGTHVGGIAAGKTYGVAKGAYLRGVRVLGCDNRGLWSDLIAGINYVIGHHIKPAVANISIGGPNSSAVNTAVANLINAGVFTAVSAGNNNADACDYSPASTRQAYTVAASTETDFRAPFSNYGYCIDVFAPGANILSAWKGADVTITDTTALATGTSMASPHVAGVAALYQSYYGTAFSPAKITDWINTHATMNKIAFSQPWVYPLISGTPNRLLYKSGL
jgi:subtilisin family serine protease